MNWTGICGLRVRIPSRPMSDSIEIQEVSLYGLLSWRRHRILLPWHALSGIRNSDVGLVISGFFIAELNILKESVPVVLNAFFNCVAFFTKLGITFLVFVIGRKGGGSSREGRIKYYGIQNPLRYLKYCLAVRTFIYWGHMRGRLQSLGNQGLIQSALEAWGNLRIWATVYVPWDISNCKLMLLNLSLSIDWLIDPPLIILKQVLFSFIQFVKRILLLQRKSSRFYALNGARLT
jgi:hypothetical protein